MHSYRLPALAPDSRPQKHEKAQWAFYCWAFFWVYIRGCSGLYLYGLFPSLYFRHLKIT